MEASCNFFGEFPDDLARRFESVPDSARFESHGLLEVDRTVLGDGVGGGDGDDVSDVPSSDDLLPLSPNLGPAGDGDSFRLVDPLVGL